MAFSLMEGARDMNSLVAHYEVQMMQMEAAKDRQIAFLEGQVKDAEYRLHECKTHQQYEAWQRQAGEPVFRSVQQSSNPLAYDWRYQDGGSRLQAAERGLQLAQRRHAEEISRFEAELTAARRAQPASVLVSGPVLAIERAMEEARLRHVSELDQLQAQITDIRRTSDPAAWLSRPVASIEHAMAIKQHAAELARLEGELQSARIASAYSSPQTAHDLVHGPATGARVVPGGTVELPPRLPPGPHVPAPPVAPPPRGTAASAVLVERRRLFGERSFRLWAEDCAARGGVRFHAMDEGTMARTHVDLRDTDVRVMFEKYCQNDVRVMSERVGGTKNTDEDQHSADVNEFLLRVLDSAYFELSESGESLELRLPLSVEPFRPRREDVDVVEIESPPGLTAGWIREKILMPKAAAAKPRGARTNAARYPAPALRAYPSYTASPKAKQARPSSGNHQASRTSSEWNHQASRTSSQPRPQSAEPMRLSSARPGSGSRQPRPQPRPQSACPSGRSARQVEEHQNWREERENWREERQNWREERERPHTVNTAGNDPYFVMGSVAHGTQWYESQSQSIQELVTEGGTPTELSADTLDFARQTPQQAPPRKPSIRPPAPPPKTHTDDGPRNGPRQHRARPQSARARYAEEAYSSAAPEYYPQRARARYAEEAYSSAAPEYYPQRSASQDHGPMSNRGHPATPEEVHSAAHRRPRPTSAKALKHKREYDDTDEPIVYDDPEEPEEWPDRHNWPQPAPRPSSASRARTPSSDSRTSSRPPSRPSSASAADHHRGPWPPSRPSSASAADQHRGPSPRPPSARPREGSQTRRGEAPQVMFYQPGPATHPGEFLLPEEGEDPPQDDYVAPGAAREFQFNHGSSMPTTTTPVDVRAQRPAAPPNLGLATESRASKPPRKPRHVQAWADPA